MSALRGLGGLTEQGLVQMIESAVTAAGPQRVVGLEVAGGVVLPNEGAVTVPIEGWREILKINESSLEGKRFVVTTARNTGQLPAYVDAIEITFQIAAGESRFELELMGRNDFPDLNPGFPKRLDIGEAANWLTSLETFEWVVSRVAEVGSSSEVVEFRARGKLGSGERIASGVYKIADLPF